MNIVFFASAGISIPSLKYLANSGHQVSCVVTQPDRRQGRGLHYRSTPVKAEAQVCGFLVFQPEQINSRKAFDVLSGLKPELFVVIAYGQILSAKILNIPSILALNLHASLLPQYRGAAPINWSIIKGDNTTGVTAIKMTEKMDTGPVILQSKTDISPDDNSLTLEKRLAQSAARVLADSIIAIENKNLVLMPQDESGVSFAPKLKREDGLIDWQKSSLEIHNLVRGCLGWPNAFTYYKGKLLKVFATKMEEAPCQGWRPGEIIDTHGSIAVATGKGILTIEKIQLEAKRVMTAQEFLSGHKIIPGEKLG